MSKETKKYKYFFSSVDSNGNLLCNATNNYELLSKEEFIKRTGGIDPSLSPLDNYIRMYLQNN